VVHVILTAFRSIRIDVIDVIVTVIDGVLNVASVVVEFTENPVTEYAELIL